MTEWNPTCNRFVGFFDIMGFKDMVFRNSHADMMEKMDAIREVIVKIETSGKRVLSNNPKGRVPRAMPVGE